MSRGRREGDGDVGLEPDVTLELMTLRSCLSQNQVLGALMDSATQTPLGPLCLLQNGA